LLKKSPAGNSVSSELGWESRTINGIRTANEQKDTHTQYARATCCFHNYGPIYVSSLQPIASFVPDRPKTKRPQRNSPHSFLNVLHYNQAPEVVIMNYRSLTVVSHAEFLESRSTIAPVDCRWLVTIVHSEAAFKSETRHLDQASQHF
jgi:hypothetical protein